jgi:SnoaL-like domain
VIADTRVQHLIDEAEISRLQLRFGAALDSKDWRAFADIFWSTGDEFSLEPDGDEG